jgi:hypothetical protein
VDRIHIPTGARGSLNLFEKLVAFAKYQIVLVNDNPQLCPE